MRISAYLFIFTFLSCYASQSDQDFNLLKAATSFSTGGTGYAGIPTEETMAFKHLFFKENAGANFHKLLLEANWTGKLYALSGLYFYDRKAYITGMNELSHVKEPVFLFAGCVLQTIELAGILESHEKDAVRLEYGQPISDWRKQAKDKTSYFDFVGGGYPQALYEYITREDDLIRLK
jgi:hypothetical protein